MQPPTKLEKTGSTSQRGECNHLLSLTSKKTHSALRQFGCAVRRYPHCAGKSL